VKYGWICGYFGRWEMMIPPTRSIPLVDSGKILLEVEDE